MSTAAKEEKISGRPKRESGLGAALEHTRTASQQCVLDLRQALGITQQKLATLMGKSLVTVARWETSRAPSGASLYELLLFAERHGQRGIARRIADVIGEAGNPGASTWSDLDREICFASVTQNLSRNSHINRAWNAYKKALKRLVDAHALLIEAAHDGLALHEDTPLDAIEFDQRMMERMYRDAEEKEK